MVGKGNFLLVLLVMGALSLMRFARWGAERAGLRFPQRRDRRHPQRHEFLMGALFDQLALIDVQNRIGLLDGRDAVGNEKYRTLLGPFCDWSTGVRWRHLGQQ